MVLCSVFWVFGQVFYSFDEVDGPFSKVDDSVFFVSSRFHEFLIKPLDGHTFDVIEGNHALFFFTLHVVLIKEPSCVLCCDGSLYFEGFLTG